MRGKGVGGNASSVEEFRTGRSSTTTGGSVTESVCRYLANGAWTDLPCEVEEAARLHILDTVAAMISGSALPPGRRGGTVARALGGPAEALVIGTREVTGATAAALANGISAHADETDDSHAPSLSHPGCAVVPAAMAAGERRGSSGRAVLRAVVAGYDIGCRVGRSLGRAAVDPRLSRPSSHAVVGTFGAAAAAAVINEADQRQCTHVLSYAAQRASGVTTWQRDVDHIEKAFVFGGSPAASGVLAAMMVELGCTGVEDVFAGHPNILDALSRDPRPSELTAELGERFEVVATNIKRYAVGSPAQAAVQAAEEIVRRWSPDVSSIVGIEILLPADLAGIVDGREMPDVNVQYLVAGTLIDGRCGFEMAHDTGRMRTEPIRALRERTTVLADESRTGTRAAELRVRLACGTVHSSMVEHVRGTTENPMTADEVSAKARDIIGPVLGAARAAEVVRAVARIDSLADVRQLRSLLSAPAE